MRIIDLLNKRANGEEVPKKIRIDHWCYKFEWVEHDSNYYDKHEDIDLMSCLSMDKEELNYEVEILEEEKELHANDIEFNINNDKRDCIITLDENDLGIDKLHLDNCYFYKENDKWYIKKYDFKNFNLEEKKIPEKLIPTSLKGIDDLNEKIDVAHIDTISAIGTINEIIDYLKSKGE